VYRRLVTPDSDRFFKVSSHLALTMRGMRFAVLALAALVFAGLALADEGPYGHRVETLTSANGLDWSGSPTVLLQHASVPSAVVTKGGGVRIYYVDASNRPENMNCADLVGGEARVRGCSIAGIPTLKALDPSIVKLKDGRYRLYYYASGQQVGGNDLHTIRRAISRDGIHFKDEGAAFRYPGLVDPDVFWTGSRWLMYVFSAADGKTVVASSKDGKRFSYVGPLSLQGWGTTAPLRLGKNRFRLYAFKQGDQRSISSFTSTDALHWTQEAGTRVSAAAGEQITDPFVVRLKGGGYRMVFKISPN
jgi:hypothetical protein